MDLVWIAFGLLVGGTAGGVIGWLIADRKLRATQSVQQAELTIAQERARDAASQLAAQTQAINDLRRDNGLLQQERAALDAQLSAERRNVEELRAQHQQVLAQYEAVRQQHAELKEQLATTMAQLDAERKTLVEQRQQFEQAKLTLREAFADVSTETLRKSTQQFLETAEQRFKTLQSEASGSLEQRKAEIAQLLQPMQVLLDEYKKKLDDIEKARGEAYTGISEKLAAVAATQQNLSRETTQLVTALRKPQARGRWGELTLKRLFEMASLAEHVTFEEQVSSGDGKLRPDCLVRLPENRQVVIDSKCVLDAFLDATTCEDESQRPIHLARHARQVRDRVNDLASKAYWDHFGAGTDFVVLFLPGEAFLYAAVEQDPDLIEYALTQRVIVASPTTLLGLLRVIEHAWRQKQVEANAEAIRAAGAELYKRVATMAEHFARIGKNLQQATSAYNDALGSLERNVFTQARRMSELGVSSTKKLDAAVEIDETVRELNPRSWAALPNPSRNDGTMEAPALQ